MAAELVTGDTGSILRITCKDNELGTAINLTGATVTLRWENASGTVTSKTMTIVTAASGICQYQFAAGEIIAGTMRFEVSITDASGYIVSNLTLIPIEVREEMA